MVKQESSTASWPVEGFTSSQLAPTYGYYCMEPLTSGAASHSSVWLLQLIMLWGTWQRCFGVQSELVEHPRRSKPRAPYAHEWRSYSYRPCRWCQIWPSAGLVDLCRGHGGRSGCCAQPSSPREGCAPRDTACHADPHASVGGVMLGGPGAISIRSSSSL